MTAIEIRAECGKEVSVVDRASEHDMTAHARRMGPGIRDDGRDKVLAGMTTVQEVLRVTMDD